MYIMIILEALLCAEFSQKACHLEGWYPDDFNWICVNLLNVL